MLLLGIVSGFGLKERNEADLLDLQLISRALIRVGAAHHSFSNITFMSATWYLGISPYPKKPGGYGVRRVLRLGRRFAGVAQ